MPSIDPYPTPRFPEADRRVKQAREAYFNHVGMKSEADNPEAELSPPGRKSPREDGGERDGAEAGPQGVAPPELKRIDRPLQAPLAGERQRLIQNQWLLRAANWTLSGFLLWGTAWSLGKALRGYLTSSIPDWGYAIAVGAILALFLSWFCWKAAQSIQRVDEMGLKPLDIPPIKRVAECYATTCLGEPNIHQLKPENKLRLEGKLNDWCKERLGWRTEAAYRREKWLWFGIVTILVVLLAAVNFLVSGYDTHQRVIVSVILAVLPAVLLVASILAMAPHTLGIPHVQELEDHYKEAVEAAEKAEEENRKRLEEYQQKVLDAQSKEIEREESVQKTETQAIAVAKIKRREEWEKTRKLLYQEFKEAVDVWNKERGYTAQEWDFMLREQKYHDRLRIALFLFALVILVFVTYPASITLNQIFHLPYQYLRAMGNFRLSIIGSGFWIVVLLVAEVALVRSMTELAVIRYQRKVLEDTYEEGERKRGKPYMILDEENARIRRRGPLIYLMFALTAVVLELACNLAYMVWYADSDDATRYLLPLVPSVLFILLTKPLIDNHEALYWLNGALGRKLWKEKDPERVERVRIGPLAEQTIRTGPPRPVVIGQKQSRQDGVAYFTKPTPGDREIRDPGAR